MRREGAFILWDIENLLYTALQDAVLNSHQEHLISFGIAAELEKIAETRGKIMGRFGVFSLALGPKLDKNLRRRRQESARLRTAQELVNCGYQIMLVPQEANAADQMLTDLGEYLAEKKSVATCILGTGDGREPFPTLATLLLARGIRVHVVSYHLTPAWFRNHSSITTSLIAGSLLSTLERETGVVPVPKRTSEEKSDTTEFLDLRSSFRSVLENPRARHPVPAHHRWICHAVATLQNACTTKRKGIPYEDLYAALEQSFETFQGEPPTKEGIKELLLALGRYSDLFGRVTTYLFNPQSKLISEFADAKAV